MSDSQKPAELFRRSLDTFVRLGSVEPWLAVVDGWCLLRSGSLGG